MSFNDMLFDIANFNVQILAKGNDNIPLPPSNKSPLNVFFPLITSSSSTSSSTYDTIPTSAAYQHALKNLFQLEAAVTAYKARTQRSKVQWKELFHSLGWLLNKHERKTISNKYYGLIKSSTKTNPKILGKKKKSHICNWCGYTNKNNSVLKIHIMRKHTKIKNHKCNICEKKFFLPTDLKYHKRIHTNERPFKCKCCDLTFKRPGTRSNHMLTHLKIKPFRCTDCKYSSITNQNLKKHIKTMHPNTMNVSNVPVHENVLRYPDATTLTTEETSSKKRSLNELDELEQDTTGDINYHLEEPKKKVARKNQETKTDNREKGNQYEQHVYVEQDFTFPIFSFEDDFLNETTTTGMVV